MFQVYHVEITGTCFYWINLLFILDQHINLDSTPGFQWGSCCSIFSFMCIFCKSLFVPFVLFLLAIVLSGLRCTDSDYPFGIFNLFLCFWHNSSQVKMLHHSDTLSWIQSKLVFALAFLVFGQTRPWHDPTIFRARRGYANHKTTTNVV
jgi:hypothetical protein